MAAVPRILKLSRLSCVCFPFVFFCSGVVHWTSANPLLLPAVSFRKHRMCFAVCGCCCCWPCSSGGTRVRILFGRRSVGGGGGPSWGARCGCRLPRRWRLNPPTLGAPPLCVRRTTSLRRRVKRQFAGGHLRSDAVRRRRRRVDHALAGSTPTATTASATATFFRFFGAPSSGRGGWGGRSSSSCGGRGEKVPCTRRRPTRWAGVGVAPAFADLGSRPAATRTGATSTGGA
mmetsp:Transcript_14506/g.29755  ORF Transcript_14506/g.29755 Transcript_14506/m.29755 type:complete len:231 (-) Transcript_14506:1201-1893(-)